MSASGSSGQDGETLEKVEHVPTPQAHDSLTGYAHRVNRYGTKHGGRNLNDTVVSRLTQRMQTPVADDAVDRKAGKFNSRGEPKLSAQVKLAERMATPTAQDANGRDRHNQRDGSQTLSLLGQVRRVPTPTQQDAHNNNALSQQDRDALNVTVGGALNPPWVEWLMHWPIGWTDLSPLPPEHFADWLMKATGPQASWWQEEPAGVPRVAASCPQRTARLTAIGNGQHPGAAALAWRLLA